MRSNNLCRIGLILVSLFILCAIVVFIKYPQLRVIFPIGKPGSPSPSVVDPINPTPHPVYYTEKAAILMYHNFDDQETDATVSPMHFREQIATLREKGYNFITLKQLSDFLAGKQDIPPNAVIITIDDGYESIYKYAYPVLAENNIPASIFVIVKNIGATANQIPKLTWEQMKEMQTHGMRFYSHSYNSHRLVKKGDGTEGSELSSPLYLPGKNRIETDSEYKSRINDDLLLSKTLLEKELNTEVDFLALPYGYKNDTVEQLAQTVGYHCLLTVDPGIVDKSSDIMSLKRITAGKIGLTGEDLHNLIISYTK